MKSVEVLEEFAEAAKHPSGRNPWDAEKHTKNVITIGISKRERETLARYWAKVDRSGGPDACWKWLAPHRRFHLGGAEGKSMVEFRRFAWTIGKPDEPIPRHVYASCRNSLCANPSHLSAKHPGQVVTGRSMTEGTNEKKRKDAPHAPRSDVRARSCAGEAIARTIEVLEATDVGERRRVLAAVAAYFEAQ